MYENALFPLYVLSWDEGLTEAASFTVQSATSAWTCFASLQTMSEELIAGAILPFFRLMFHFSHLLLVYLSKSSIVCFCRKWRKKKKVAKNKLTWRGYQSSQDITSDTNKSTPLINGMHNCLFRYIMNQPWVGVRFWHIFATYSQNDE